MFIGQLTPHELRNLEKKRAFINSLEATAPVDCELKVGDIVTYTNEYGVSFDNREIVGFSSKEDMLRDRFIHLDQDAYWFPLSIAELKLAKRVVKTKTQSVLSSF